MTRAGALALGMILLSACATRGPAPAGDTAGYLDEAAVDQIAALAPSPRPSEDDAAPEVSMDRWWLATLHAELRPPEAAQHFDCALGTRLTARPRPALTRLLDRLAVDAARVTERAAARHPRARPIADPSVRPCQRVTEAVRRSPSWPAGGAVVGSAFGEAIADLAPDRAGPVRAIGREIGISRVVCRMNRWSEASDGAALGQALYARASASEALQRDLAAARVEIAAARAEGLSSPGCAAERRALGLRPAAG